VIASQSTLIHQTAISGKKLIKSTWCEKPRSRGSGVIDHFQQADLSLPIVLDEGLAICRKSKVVPGQMGVLQ
jgi:hypothetical protein